MPASTNAKVNHVVLLHGYAGGAEKQWFPWLHDELEKLGLRVSAPTMPDPLKPDYEKWMRAGAPYARQWGPQTIVIAHSLGGAFALRLLQRASKQKIHALFLVSPLYAAIINVAPLLKFFEKRIDWSDLKDRAGIVEIMHAKNDPLVPFDHGIRYAESLNGKLHLLPKGGHINGRTFPYLLKTLKKYL